MQTMKLVINAPEGTVFKNEIISLQIDAEDGSFGIYPKKSDCLIALASGPVQIGLPDGKNKIGACGSGIALVKNNTVTLTVSDFLWQEDIDVERQKASISRLKEKLTHKEDMLHKEYILSQSALARAEARMEALGIQKR